jgi:hypothetical protein
MQTAAPLRTAILTLGGLLIAGAAHAQTCEPIQFEQGHYSGTVRGVAPPEDPVCYTLSTGAGQHADVQVEGRNVVFGILDLVDGQDRYSFATDKKTYTIHVGQLMRSITNEPFTLMVTVR